MQIKSAGSLPVAAGGLEWVDSAAGKPENELLQKI